jgi:hypothetical protein
MITFDAILMNPGKREHFRRALMLAHVLIDLVKKEHPHDWKERLAEAGRREFEGSGATPDDYLRSLRVFEDSIV